MQEILKDLIKFKTLKNKPEELQKCNDYIFDYLTNNSDNSKIKKFEHNNKPSIVATIGSENFLRPKIMLHAHYDVVEGNEDQFEPMVKEDKFYGRGSLDMKSGVAMAMKIFCELSRQDNPPSLGVMFTSDEEIGGMDGARYLIEDEKVRPDFFITLEGDREHRLIVKNKGILHIKAEAKGKSAHGSYTWEGENAVDKLYHLINKIRKVSQGDSKKHKYWKTTLNLGKISGGITINTVPDYAEAELDIRFSPEEWPDSQTLFKKIKETAGEGEKVSVLAESYPVDIVGGDEYLNNLAEIMKNKLNIKRDVFGCDHGGHDARFAYGNGISAVSFGPVGADYHGPSEWVSLKSMQETKDILVEFIKKYA